MLRSAREDFLNGPKGIMPLPKDSRINGAVVIIRVKETGNILLSLDKDKQRPNLRRWCFSGGEKENYDRNIASTVKRELREELSLYAGYWMFSFVGLVPLLGTETIKLTAVFFAEITEAIAKRIRPGREQLAIEPKSREDIEKLAVVPSEVPGEELLGNHRNYLVAFKEWETRNPTA
jgi:8-oxo-dGTP pyrophosphatase MutT (NUDIX family)